MKISNCLIHRIKNNKITIRQQLLEDHTLKVGTFYAHPDTRKGTIKKCQREMVLI